MTWETSEEIASVQVRPDDDIIEHVSSPHCPCAPQVTWYGTTSRIWGKLEVTPIYTHNAMDGRPD